jgi:acetylornithine/N-succinyldiaminopimelate aminotransferase
MLCTGLPPALGRYFQPSLSLSVVCGGLLFRPKTSSVTSNNITSGVPVGRAPDDLPLGVVLVKEEIALCLAPGDHGTTFGGNPLACTLGKVALDRVSDKAMLDRVNSN